VVSAESTEMVELNTQQCSQQTKDKYIRKDCTVVDAKARIRE